MKSNPTYKYNWLLNQLKMSDGLTLEEITKRYKQSEMYANTRQTLSERTFHHWRNDILETYGIEKDLRPKKRQPLNRMVWTIDLPT